MSGNRVLLTGIALAMMACGAPAAPKDARSNLDSDAHLIAWWKFDETSGKTAADSAKQPHNGTLEGGLTFDAASIPGRFGKAIQFDGKAQVIRIESYKGIAGTQTRTVSAWLKTTTTRGEIVSWGLPDAGKMFIFSFIRGRPGVTPRGGYLYMKKGIEDNQWHHVAVVVKEGSPPNLHDHVKLYLDGEVAEIDDIGLLDLWPIDTGEKQDVTIGRQFKGAIDDLRIYDRALSEDEIIALFKAKP